MKKGFVLTLSLIGIFLTSYGQKGNPTTIAFQISGRTDQMQLPFAEHYFSSQTTADTSKLTEGIQVVDGPENKELFNEIFFICNPSIIGGLKPGACKQIVTRAYSPAGFFLAKKKEHTNCASVVLSKLSLLYRGFPFLINLLTKQNRVALKLTCQKTSFGAANKACKKVTGITFSLPIAITQ